MDEQPNAEIASNSEPLTTDMAAAMLSRALDGDTARAPNGQFAQKNPDRVETLETEAEAANAEESKVVDLKTKQPVKAEQPAEDEEDYFEFPAEEEGKEPRRVKADEVLKAYEELPRLREELEKTKAIAPPPEDYVQGIEQTVRTRTDLMQGLRVVAQMIQPREPSLDLLNPGSEKYDPEAYYMAKQKAEQDRAYLAQMSEKWEANKKAREAEEAILAEAREARETAALNKAWPDWQKQESKVAVYKQLREYGFSDKEIENISDHRMVLLARDAMELRASKAEKVKAVEVVRSKPKLVKGAARSTTNPQTANREAAMSRLQKTGSMDAAAEALKGLI